MKVQKRVTNRRNRRAFRVRNRVRSIGKLRLSVFRSNCHMYAQIIDDAAGNTVVSASTIEPAIAGPSKYAGNVEGATKVGQLLAERAKEKGIDAVAFDRGSYKYHGRVKALADAAREGGLNF
ncbi:50S ribosomal protein L18 [Rubinisphaera italica]|uniref:Large ribosomal subunit protein uL18 n=1 Tax=Rubinisphaera italica TaxID=2527969 RepID=A0A5C5XJ82_9PLAN|nr:50S ribosomal protein L18 [Rubinisphaera italica]TWT63080.1 50S ribosomal protein L18 [Rubinisphaera italica]